MPAPFSILVVDDDPNLVDILSRAAASCFEQAQFSKIQAFKEATAYLDGLRGAGPHLVLLDVNLQAFHSGLDFLALVRQHPQGRLLPIIILSASLDAITKEMALDLGANALTEKPETFDGWKRYVSQLRAYWFETVTLPRLWFEKDRAAPDN